jgi:catechol 2,3-dioxygenase-like lactoylglutathione lyase family enzyme
LSDTASDAIAQPVNCASLSALGLSAFGVVFGEIGTSPLYRLETVLGDRAKQYRRGVSCPRRSIAGISGNGIWEAIMFKRIDHVEIVTDQLHRTVQFYTEVLGFTVKARDRIERSGLGVPIDLVYLDLGGTVVELIGYEGTQVDAAPLTEHLGYRMIALEVDDMQKTADYLRTKGVDIVWGPRVRETYSRAEICDPNGFHIELRQWFR